MADTTPKNRHGTFLGAASSLFVLPLVALVLFPLGWLITFVVGLPILMLW